MELFTSIFIYALINNETKEIRYIGQTSISLVNRLKTHLKTRNPKNKHLRNWILSCTINIIELERNPDNLNLSEIKWIKMFKKIYGKRILNISNGGEGGFLGRKHTEKTRAGISSTLKGRRLTDETRKKMSAAKKLQWKNKEYKERPKDVPEAC